MSLPIRLAMGAALACSLFTSLPALADCTSDVECKGDRVCDAGKCVALESSRGTCSKDTDCGGDDVCESGTCVSEKPCASGQHRFRGRCVDDERAAPVPTKPSPSPPPPDLVSVRFEGDDGLVVDAGEGANCRVPCSLDLPSGSRTIAVSGSASFSRVVEIPSHGSATVTLRRACVGCYVGGGIIAGLGIAAFVVGTVNLAAVSEQRDICKKVGSISPNACDEANPITMPLGGLIVGALSTCLGIGLLAAGGSSGAELVRREARSGSGHPARWGLSLSHQPNGFFAGASFGF